MQKLFNLLGACVFGILLYGMFIKSEVAKYKITQWVRCPDSNLRYLTLTGISIGECAYECKIRPICKSVGYRRLLHWCDIFSKENLELLKNTRGDPCVFVNRTDIEQDSTPGCNCTEGQVCKGDAGCEVRECYPYNTTGVKIRGNQNHIGAKVKCGRGWESVFKSSAECNADGNWSYELQCTSSKCPASSESWISLNGNPSLKILINQENRKRRDVAEEWCNSQSARLVQIESMTIHNYIIDILSSCEELDKYRYWIGGSRPSWWEGRQSWNCPKIKYKAGKALRQQYQFNECRMKHYFICEKTE